MFFYRLTRSRNKKKIYITKIEKLINLNFKKKKTSLVFEDNTDWFDLVMKIIERQYKVRLNQISEYDNNTNNIS